MLVSHCLAAFLALLGSAAPIASAQAQTPAPMPPAPSTSAPAASAPISPTLGLLPLKKALRPLSGEGLLRSQSHFQMTGDKQGISFTFREDARIIAKRPGRFRAELIQLATDNTPQMRLLVISNGVKVWTYRPGTRQYSVSTYKAFQAANNDVTALGLAVGGFFLGDGHQLMQGFQGLTKDNSAAVTQALAGMGIILDSQTQAVNGEDDFVYRMELTKQGLSYRFNVNSATNTLRRVELSGAQKDLNIAFHEEIVHLIPLTTAPKDIFVFTPPLGAVKVTTLSVDPF